MEKVYSPDERKWISPLTHLGKAMEEMKRLVRLQKEELFTIDPTSLTIGDGRSVEGDAGGTDDTNPGSKTGKEPEFINLAGANFNEEDVIIEEENLQLREELEREQRNKWSITDDLCQEAVDSVGGSEFFELGKRKSKGGRRGRRKKRVESSDEDSEEEYVDEDELNMELDDLLEGREKDEAEAMYEAYNYGNMDDSTADQNSGNGGQGNEGGVGVKQEPLTIDEMKLRKLEKKIPEALALSDDDEDLLVYDNDVDNYASQADRFEMYQKKYGELFPSDSDESGSERNMGEAKLSDEGSDTDRDDDNSDSEEVRPLVVDEDEGGDGGASGSTENIVPPPPGPNTTKSCFKNRSGPRRRRQLTLPPDASNRNGPGNDNSQRFDQGQQSGCSQASGTLSDKPTTSRDTNEIPLISEAEDFKRFNDWIFNQSMKMDKRYRAMIRPELAKTLKRSEEEIAKLQRFTSASLSTVKGEIFQDEPVTKSAAMPLLAPPIDLSERSTLQSLTIFITHGDDPSCFPWKSVNVQQQMNDDFEHDKYMRRLEQQKIDVMNPDLKDELVDKEEDFLIQVLVYQATDPEDILPDEVKIYIEPKLAYELHILGSQTVKDLMGSIHCENDYSYMENVDHPETFVEDPNQYAKNKFPSKMMLVHETVFSDPNITNVDYVKILNNWVERPPDKHIGPFKQGDWNTQFKDIELRFGFPYVFSHLGGCEHIIVFTKARLLHLEDEHLKRNYPKVCGMPRFKNVYCRVDNEYLARWAVLDFKELPENPMLLCTECVLTYCFDKQKRRRGDFRLYPFTQLANIL